MGGRRVGHSLTRHAGTLTPHFMSDDKKVELTAEAQKILDAVKNLKVLDLANLVKAMEEEFGVSAAAPVAMAAAPAAGAAAPAAEEKSMYDVELADGGANKIAVIKVVKEITGQGLGEAKAMVEGAPAMVKTGVAKADAEAMKKKIEEAGGKVNLK